MYRGSDSLIRDAEVAPKCLLRSHVKKKKKARFKAALMWPRHGNKESRRQGGVDKKEGGEGKGRRSRKELSRWGMTSPDHGTMPKLRTGVLYGSPSLKRSM